MVEIAEFFVNLSERYSLTVVIAAGVCITLAGLFIWLGGLGLRKTVLFCAGMAAGFIAGNVFFPYQPAVVLLLAMIGAIVSFLIERVFITVLTVGILLAAAYAVLSRGGGEETESLKDLLWGTSWQTLAILGGLAVAVILAGIFVYRVTSCLCYSGLGAALIFLGMILLLDVKGAKPLESMESRQQFLSAVFVAMVVFGALIQLLLFAFSGRGKEPAAKKKAEPGEDSVQSNSWRTS